MNQKHVSHDPKLGTFTVIGSNGTPRVLGSEYCSYSAACVCYHITAVKLRLGTAVGTAPKKVTSTELRRNTRAKKSGRGHHVTYRLLNTAGSAQQAVERPMITSTGLCGPGPVRI